MVSAASTKVRLLAKNKKLSTQSEGRISAGLRKHSRTFVFFYTSCTTKVWTTGNKEIKKNFNS